LLFWGLTFEWVSRCSGPFLIDWSILFTEDNSSILLSGEKCQRRPDVEFRGLLVLQLRGASERVIDCPRLLLEGRKMTTASPPSALRNLDDFATYPCLLGWAKMGLAFRSWGGPGPVAVRYHRPVRVADAPKKCREPISVELNGRARCLSYLGR